MKYEYFPHSTSKRNIDVFLLMNGIMITDTKSPETLMAAAVAVTELRLKETLG